MQRHVRPAKPQGTLSTPFIYGMRCLRVPDTLIYLCYSSVHYNL